MPEFSRKRMRSSFLHQLPLLVWLVVLWTLLWGSLSPLTLLTGLLMAIFVMRVFYLPPVQLSGRFNIVQAVIFICTFVYDVVRGSFQVAWLAIDPRKVPRSAVIAVQLGSRSDLIMLLVSINISLVPGSLVVEADRFRSKLYVHAIDIDSEEDIEKARQTVLTVERRIVRVIGSKEDLRIIEAKHAASEGAKA